MDRALLRKLSLAFSLSGIVSLSSMVPAYFSARTVAGFTGGTTLYPFRYLSGFLFVIGIVCLLLGLCFLWASKREGSET